MADGHLIDRNAHALRRLALTASVVALAFAATAAQAQDAPVAPDETAEDIVVTGDRASTLAAIRIKRDAPTIIEAVSADTVGKLPDYNPAEAIQRLPGVSVQIDQGEARYAVVRGVDSNLNNVTIDGNLVGAPEAEGRRVSLDTIPSDLVASIEVIKAVTADYDANAVGGTINIRTPSAFDRADSFLFGSLRGSLNDIDGRLGGGGSLTYGTRFGGDDSFGIVAAASYNKRFLSSQTANPVSWIPRGPGVRNAPAQYQLYDYEITRERIGAVLNLEWRGADLSLYIRNIYNEYTDEEGRDFLDYDYDRGTATILSPTSIRYSRGRGTRAFRQNNQTQKLLNVSPGGEWDFGGGKLAFNYTYANASEHTPVRDDLDAISPDTLNNTIDLSPSRPVFSQINPAIANASIYNLRRFQFRSEEIDETLHSGRADVTFGDVFGDTEGFIKLGGKYLNRHKTRDSRRLRYDYTGAATLAGAMTNDASPYYNGDYPGVFGPRLDYGKLLGLFDANSVGFTLNTIETLRNDFNVDYGIREKIYAGYGMGSITLGDLTAIGGVRVEHTDTRSTAFSVRDADGDRVLERSDITPLTGVNRYTDVLPSLHLNYRPSDDVQIRAAYTNTIGRPNYDAAVPTFEEDAGVGSAGNPDLKPFKSMGLDLTAEFYPAREAIVSAGVFYKKIENPIYNGIVLNTVLNGVPLTQLSQPLNAKSGYILGVEANLQYQLSFLPAPLDGLGVSVNGTYVKSDLQVPGREAEDIPFFRQSDRIANAAIFYAIGRIEARVALSYRDDYIESIGAVRTSDIYNKARAQLDAKLSFDLTDKIELFGTASNITNAPLAFYQADKTQTFSREIYSYSLSFGISGAF
ncbi:TonB-dependent receptor [Sphingomonas sp. SUN019]|uniref:TonB-dependent receptor n=1 Tax=Sphingomonas sp. SUN019 TaxID=2937788 RepID=UPI002164684C|nr:TonB-dependent receptor [Sphingomonas sp. SUN019]UVO50576.1 TonB-dependent receptor [Sphingomonas sp. SUN019]